MADKTIGELTAAEQVQAADLFVLEQSGTAKKLTGQTLENWLLTMADGHGGIQTIAKVSTSGLVDTYRITFADTTSTTFTVTNGRGITGLSWATSGTVGNGQQHIGTFSYGDGTTSSVTIRDGYKGDTGATGATGPGAQLTSAIVQYQKTSSDSSVPPDDGWGAANVLPSNIGGGDILWSKTTITFDTGEPVIILSKTRYGIDGTGSVSTVNGVSPNANGNVTVPSDAIPTVSGTVTSGTVQAELNDISDDVSDLKSWQTNFTAASISAVSYGAQQSLTTAQKIQAQTNMGIDLSALATTSAAVLASEAQTFTEAQQSQARDNIGASSIDITEETTSQSYSCASGSNAAFTMNLSRTGYTPLGVLGWRPAGTGQSWIAVPRLFIRNGVLLCEFRNLHASSEVSLSFTFTVLWAKDNS